MSQNEISVRDTLTPPRRKRKPVYRETLDYLAMVRRIVRNAGTRVRDGDLDELRALVDIKRDVDNAIFEAERGALANGHSFTEIGAITGVTKQSAHEWYKRREAAAERSPDQ